MNKMEFSDRVRACERRLYRIARTMLKSDADCEDAVQEALLKAWAKLPALREDAYFETWLMRILINQCRTFYRRRARAEVELTEDIPSRETGDSTLLDALMKLPEKPRVALELHYIEGYDVKACARMLGVPEGTVKWRLHQGRKLLKRELGEEAPI